MAALVGDAGVGKSRLVYECVHSHQTQGWLVLESASVSYGKATPYYPVLDLLRRYCHLEDHDDTRIVRTKATGQILTLDAALQDTLPALLALLDALPEDSPFRTLDALQRVLLRESQVQPLLLVCEDLHWIDSETQALLNSLVESLSTAWLLLLVNYRPEYQPGWGSKTYYTQLRLDPFSPGNAEELLQTVICTFIFYGHGLGLFGTVSRVQQIVIVFAVWVLQLVVPPLWLRSFQFGPLEWLWRSLTYRRLAPLHRRVARVVSG